MILQHSEVDDLFEKNPRAAEQQLEKHLKMSPKDVQAHLMLGTVRLKLSKYEEAVQAFRNALRAEANNRPAQVLLATALEQANDLPHALEAWVSITKAEPTSADAQAHVAKLADVVGKKELALDARRELVKLQPQDPLTVADLAVHLSRAKKHAEAVKLFEKANSLSPGFLEKNPTEASEYQKSKAATAKR